MDVDLTPILEDLAAGRIDAAEANRRIALAQARQADDAVREADAQLDEALTGARAAGTADESQASVATSWSSLARDLAGAAAGLAGSAVRTAASAVGEQVANARTQDVPPVRTGRRPAGAGGVERLVVHATGRQVTVVADPSVATLAVNGPHRRERSDGVVEVYSEAEVGGGLDLGRVLSRFSPTDVPRLMRGEVRRDDLRRMVAGRPVVVRVNPAIPVDVEASGCALEVDGVEWLGRVRITAGTARLAGVHEVEDALVQAAIVRLAGTFDGPRSRVRVESGGLRVELSEGADVTVRGQSSLGRISWPEPGASSHLAGLGSGRLELHVTLGQATVSEA